MLLVSAGAHARPEGRAAASGSSRAERDGHGHADDDPRAARRRSPERSSSSTSRRTSGACRSSSRPRSRPSRSRSRPSRPARGVRPDLRHGLEARGRPASRVAAARPEHARVGRPVLLADARRSTVLGRPGRRGAFGAAHRLTVSMHAVVLALVLQPAADVVGRGARAGSSRGAGRSVLLTTLPLAALLVIVWSLSSMLRSGCSTAWATESSVFLLDGWSSFPPSPGSSGNFRFGSIARGALRAELAASSAGAVVAVGALLVLSLPADPHVAAAVFCAAEAVTLLVAWRCGGGSRPSLPRGSYHRSTMTNTAPTIAATWIAEPSGTWPRPVAVRPARRAREAAALGEEPAPVAEDSDDRLAPHRDDPRMEHGGAAEDGEPDAPHAREVVGGGEEEERDDRHQVADAGVPLHAAVLVRRGEQHEREATRMSQAQARKGSGADRSRSARRDQPEDEERTVGEDTPSRLDEVVRGRDRARASRGRGTRGR